MSAVPQGLHLALLVAGQDQGVFRRVQIQPNHILELFGESGVVGQFEGAPQMRLQTMGPPDSPDRGLADPGGLRHRTPAPVRGVGRLLFKRPLHNPGLFPAADRRQPSTSGRVLCDPSDALFQESIAPSSGFLTRDVQPGSNILIIQPIGSQQDDPGPFRQSNRAPAPAGTA